MPAFELFEQWQEADALATNAERLLAAAMDAHAEKKGPMPTYVRIEVVEALRETARARLHAALDAYEKIANQITA